MLRDYQPVANGLRTDHPIPDLPFVDDSHIPVEDARALEAVGRRRDEGMWGRQDPCRDGGWVGFTTDPVRRDLAWVVRWHPEHGRSVVLHRDEHASGMHSQLQDQALLFRSGGYWWDGTTWYRPAQIWDRAGERYVRRPVPGAATVTAADLIDAGVAGAGRLLEVTEVDLDASAQGSAQAPAPGRWVDDLALWAARRQEDGRGPLSGCVVRISAPELTGDQLVGLTEFAEIAGVAPSTVRAYVSRGEADVPLPQATIAGRSAWARVVAEEWAERRRDSADSVREAVATNRDRPSMAPGIEEVWDRFTSWFFSALWENPDRRRRWALRWRNEAAVHDLAEDLGWQVAAGVDQLIPLDALAVTIRQAVLDDFATGQQNDRTLAASRAREAGETSVEEDPVFFGIMPKVARMLDWLIRHDPRTAQYAIGEIVGQAERRFGIAREVSARSLRTALALDGKLDADAQDEYLDRVLSPMLSDAGGREGAAR